jgi:hypothetical protein
MSTARDIFNSIINQDNVSLTQHITDALLDRSTEKIESMREYVGKSLFKENIGVGTYYNAHEYHPIHTDLKTAMSIAHRKEEHKTQKFGGKSYTADFDEKNGENTEYENNTRRKADRTYMINGYLKNTPPTKKQLEQETQKTEWEKINKEESKRELKKSADMRDAIDNNRGRK